MRLAWYTGISTGLAVTVILSAFHQRANFYSAMVYLAQSNLCLLVLVNFVYILYGIFIFGLQRLCFGRLRPVEIEQLADRAWIAITETCLAMTIFREEIGAWFLVMFTALVTGKVWGWIGDGRLEVLEQQPPANPRLFHTRLVVSLFMSSLYDVWVLRYAVNTVFEQARPNMMVMFLFEFAVLAACSIRTNFRYVLQIVESRIIARQTRRRLEERRREVQRQRDDIISRREAAESLGETVNDEALPDPNDVDEMDIEVPGWEAKGQYVLTLELITDFIKLAIYLTFFSVLLMFYGLPVHILRDLYMTGSAFFRRLAALHKYRKAIQSMKQYPDATPEDLGREDTCIICRDVMHGWDPVANPGAVERSRPKKLPCGHILHFGCLKSWLERQQVCPTCRSPVTQASPAQTAQNQNGAAVRPAVGAPGVLGNNNNNALHQGHQQQPGGGLPQRDGANGNPPDQNGAGLAGPVGGAPPPPAGINHRQFNFGPFRLEFIRHDGRNPQALDALLDGRHEDVDSPAASPMPNFGGLRALTPEFDQLIQREMMSLQSLHHMQQELQTAQLLVNELVRLRQLQQLYQTHQQQHDQLLAAHGIPPMQAGTTLPGGGGGSGMQSIYHTTRTPPLGHQLPHLTSLASSYPYRMAAGATPSVTRHNAAPNATAIPAGSPDLPEGLTLPQGWSIFPLQRMDAATTPVARTPPPQQQQQQQSSSSTSAQQATFPYSTTSSVATDSHYPPATSDGGPSASPATAAPQGQSVTVGEASPVVAPNPVMPNWGASASPFDGLRGGGGRPATPDLSTEPTPTSAATTTIAGAAAPSSGGVAEDGGEAPASSDKGKRRAVTVEEAEDEEEQQT